MIFKDIRLIAIDADDTLWDCQTHFDAVEDRYFEILAPYGNRKYLADEFFATEKNNMASLGFGSKAFTISLVENALRISRGTISTAMIAEIISLGKSLLEMPATPLPEVDETLKRMRTRPFKLVLFTKGEIIEQENKLARSGLGKYFDDVEIVADKTEDAYRRLCRIHRVAPENMAMIGNSFKSDIAPALAIGAKAVHIPYHVTWKMEHAEEFEHINLVKISHFSEIIDYFC